MKRVAFIMIGLIYGLFLTWLCLYIASHVEWSQSGKAVGGCHELGKCPYSWWDGFALFLDVFGSPVLFGVLNAVAWKRWTAQKWFLSFGGLNILTIAYRLSGYVL